MSQTALLLLLDAARVIVGLGAALDSCIIGPIDHHVSLVSRRPPAAHATIGEHREVFRHGA